MASVGTSEELVEVDDYINKNLSSQLSSQKIETTTTSKTSDQEKSTTYQAESQVDTETRQISSLTSSDIAHPNIPNINFVINTIALVPERKSDDDSSDEDEDGTFTEEDFKSCPFTTERPKHARKTTDIEELPVPARTRSESIIVAPFLQKLAKNGFEKKDTDKLETSVSVSIGLNRMLSLSERKNRSLSLELESAIETNVRYEIFGFYWKCNWYNSKGIPVEYSRVKKFYKQLKRKDPKEAKRFISDTECGILVPYQNLREYAKNHNQTKKLIKEFREKALIPKIYLSLVDSDTFDFNGIYSAYLRLAANSAPTVMSTGYEFSANGAAEDKVFELGSHIDRMIRVLTARHIPLGTYYPEPNTCFLIPPESETIPESFIDKDIKDGDLESASLLRKVKSRKNATFKFSDDNPLITTIPERAKRCKSSKRPIKELLSSEFKKGASPTQDDLRLLKQISQSNFHEKIWDDNIFINGAITVRECKITDCKSLICKIRNENRDKAITEIKKKNYMDNDVVDAIVKAVEERRRYINEIKKDYIRSEDEEKLLQIFKEGNIEISNFSRDKILALAKMLQDKEIEISDILNLIETAQSHNEDFLEALQLFIITIDKREYLVSVILQLYKENPLHLMFMSGEPDDIILENSDNEEIVDFGIEHYEIDIDWVRSELDGDRDGDSAALMDFDRIMMKYDHQIDSDYDIL